MKKRYLILLMLSLSFPAQAKSGKKSAKRTAKLNAYVNLLNLTGGPIQSTSKNLSSWKDRGYLGDGCATKNIRWPTGLVSYYARMQSSFEDALKLKGKTEADAIMKKWLNATVPLKEADTKIAAYFANGLYKKDSCAEAKKLVAGFENSLSEYAGARRDVSVFFKEKETEEMRASVKKIRKKHGDGYWYAQANLTLQEKLLLAVMEDARSGDQEALKELSQGYKRFSADLDKLNRKMKKQEVRTQSSYVSWARAVNSFSESLDAFLKIQEEESFSKLKKYEKAKLKNKGNFKTLIQAYNYGVDLSNRIQYTKKFH